MSSYFSPLRKSIFWYNKVAFELLLGTSVVNALLVYNKLSQKKVQISDFRESLVISMLKLDHNDQQLQASTSRCKHKLEMSQEKLGNNRKKRKRCSGCYAKYSQKMTSKEAKVKSKQINTYCSGCDDKPYLCLECYDAHIKNQQWYDDFLKTAFQSNFIALFAPIPIHCVTFERLLRCLQACSSIIEL